MDQFSYLSVLLSIIVGLAITQILKGYRGIMLSRSRVQLYWPAVLWSATLLLMNVQSWWAMFGLRNVHLWTFARFSVVLAQAVAQYLLAGIVLPDFFGERIDLRRHYFDHTRWFFGLTILMLLISLSKDLLPGGRPEALNVGFHLVFIAFSAIALATRREWFHKSLALATAALFCIYIAVLFSRLPETSVAPPPDAAAELPGSS